MRSILVLISLTFSLLATVWGQNMSTPHPGNFSQIPSSLDQSLTAPVLSSIQLEAFTERAELQVQEFFEYLRFAQDSTVDSALRQHAHRLLLQDLDPSFRLIGEGKVYTTKELFSSVNGLRLLLTPAPVALKGWQGEWQAGLENSLQRELALYTPMLLQGKSIQAVSCMLKLEKIEKQFGKESMAVWEVRILSLQVEKGKK